MRPMDESEKGPRWVNGFDVETPYDTLEGRRTWHEFLRSLDPQSACRLCGIDHFPHWLAAAPNWEYLVKHLAERYPRTITVKEALVKAIKERRADPRSEERAWWKAMEHLVPALETFAYLYTHGLVKPLSKLSEEIEGAITWPVPEKRKAG